MSNKKVLVVDDEPEIVEVVKFNLELENHTVIEAHDGMEALKLARAEKPDLIILDVMLPKMNGFKVARLLKFDEAFKHIPIIMLTARSQKADFDIGEQTKADHYLTKPFDMTELIALVNKFLGES